MSSDGSQLAVIADAQLNIYPVPAKLSTEI